MSNATTIQNHNTTITDNNLTIDDILETINNLPEAGSGSGGQYATGTFTMAEGPKTSGSTIATVTGLAFKPSHIVITSTDGRSITVTSTSYKVLALIEEGLCSICKYVAKTSTGYASFYNSSSLAEITITDDGFALTSLNSSLYTTSSYSYIAFGGDFENKG